MIGLRIFSIVCVSLFFISTSSSVYASSLNENIWIVGNDAGGLSKLAELDSSGASIREVILPSNIVATSVAYASNDQFYVGTLSGDILLIDLAGNVLNSFPSYLGSVGGLSANGGQVIAGDGWFPDQFVYTQEPSSNFLTPAGPRPLSGGPFSGISAVAIDPSDCCGSTFVGFGDANVLYTFDSSGNLRDGFSTLSPIEAMTIDASGQPGSTDKIFMSLSNLSPSSSQAIASQASVSGKDILIVDFSGNAIGSISTSYATIVGMTMGPATVVPVPSAIWLFGSGLLGLAGMARRKKAT